MNLLEAILGAQNGGVVDQLGQQFGLNQQQTNSAIGALLPSLASGLARNASSQDGLGALMGALTSGNHGRFVDNLGQLGLGAATQEGNGILGHILGSKDVSRQVAAQAAAQTGISDDLLKKMLPVLASLAMGMLAKQGAGAARADAGFNAGPAAAGGGILDMLTPMLDRNRDGSVVDDVVGMMGKFLGSR